MMYAGMTYRMILGPEDQCKVHMQDFRYRVNINADCCVMEWFRDLWMRQP